MAHKYLVDLTEEERGYLLNLINKGKPAARRVARAHVLLRAAEGATDDEIAQAFHLGVSTVHRTRQRFVDEGLLPALSERRRPGQRPALTGKQAVFLVALACSTPPAGRRRLRCDQLERDPTSPEPLLDDVPPVDEHFFAAETRDPCDLGGSLPAEDRELHADSRR